VVERALPNRQIRAIERRIRELTARLSRLYDESLELAISTRKAIRPKSETDADKYEALREGVAAGRAATASLDTEIEQLEHQRDALYERLAELEGRSAEPTSLRDFMRDRLTERLEKVVDQWRQCVLSWEEHSSEQPSPAVRRILDRLNREATDLRDQIERLDREAPLN